MKFVKYSTLNKKEKDLIDKAFKTAEHSVSKNRHKVGCAILCENGDIFLGATNERSHTLGSTCAERMAVDQLYFHGNRRPKLCTLVGSFDRADWSNNSVTTPCGICLEMFRELIKGLGMGDLDFLCSSWNRNKILRVRLTKLYPRLDEK